MIGLGSDIKINDGDASAFVSVSGLVMITPPNDQVRTVESKLIGPSVVPFYPTRTDPGQLKIQFEHSRTEFNRLKTLRGAAKSFKIITANGDNFAVNGFITIVNMGNLEAETVVATDCTVQLTSDFASITAAS